MTDDLELIAFEKGGDPMGTKENEAKTKQSLSSHLGTVLVWIGAVCLVVSLYFSGSWPFSLLRKEAFESPAILGEAEDPLDGKLYITGERQVYEDGSLRLVIPKLGIDTAVGDGVSEEVLEKGPGLYDYAQLPGTGNRNVSIAGHRDIHGSIFYSIDTLAEDDYLYLVYGGTIYRYTYRDTTIVNADDWGPIYNQGFSCLTLTSCDPIGTSLNRIIVRSELSERVPETDHYEFRAAYEP